MISCSQLVHGFGQSSRDYSALPHNWRDDLSWSSGRGSHGECTSVYGHTLDKTCGESWCKVIKLSWFIKLLCCMDSQPWEDIEPVLKLVGEFC